MSFCRFTRSFRRILSRISPSKCELSRKRNAYSCFCFAKSATGVTGTFLSSIIACTGTSTTSHPGPASLVGGGGKLNAHTSGDPTWCFVQISGGKRGFVGGRLRSHLLERRFWTAIGVRPTRQLLRHPLPCTFSVERPLTPLPTQSRDLGRRAGFHARLPRQNRAAIPLAQPCLGCIGLGSAQELLRIGGGDGVVPLWEGGVSGDSEFS
jgi:hypothetical protein